MCFVNFGKYVFTFLHRRFINIRVYEYARDFRASLQATSKLSSNRHFFKNNAGRMPSLAGSVPRMLRRSTVLSCLLRLSHSKSVRAARLFVLRRCMRWAQEPLSANWNSGTLVDRKGLNSKSLRAEEHKYECTSRGLAQPSLALPIIIENSAAF